MNSSWILVIGVLWLTAAYLLYGRWIERRLIHPDNARRTPAHRLRDGVDYFPTRPLILFGHHFASIAGAGPIIGPVLAVGYFGYGLSLVWIVIGVVFVGAVHDYTTLMLSVRHGGNSIPSLAGDILGSAARVLFLVFVWVTLIFVIAVFLIAAKNTFINEPRVVIPALGMIPLAILFGWLNGRVRVPLIPATILALGILVVLFALGMNYPVAVHVLSAEQQRLFSDLMVLQPFITDPTTASYIWIFALMAYGGVAAVLPVWVLLQPRDYLGYWVLAAGMLFGFAGMLLSPRPLTAPVHISTASVPVWPMLFIFVACGAVSGFHSLVSSGTTSKQLDRESHGRPIVFGAMLLEGALAIMAVLAVSAGLSWSETPASIQRLSEDLLSNPIGAFAEGFGQFTRGMLGEYGGLFGVVMINAFVLTTLDTSVRLSRFVTTELLGTRFCLFQNRIVTTLGISLVALLLAATDSVDTLWKMFGATNQLVAALAMIVVTVYLMKSRLPIRYTLVPAVFLLVTTCGALIWQISGFVRVSAPGNTILLFTASFLLFVALFVGWKAGMALYRQYRVQRDGLPD